MLKNKRDIIEYLNSLLAEQDRIIMAAQEKKGAIQADIRELTKSEIVGKGWPIESKKETFEDWLVGVFADGRPKRSKELHQLFIAQIRPIKRNILGSKLAIVCAKKNARIKPYKYEGRDKREQFIYGLTLWGGGRDHLPKDYIEKVKASEEA